MFRNQLICKLKGQAKYFAISEAALKLQRTPEQQLSGWGAQLGAQLLRAQNFLLGRTGDRLISRYWVLFKGELCMIAF